MLMGSDFGMMGEMKENLRDGLIEASVHLVNREFDALAGDFVTLGYEWILLFHLCMSQSDYLVCLKNVLNIIQMDG